MARVVVSTVAQADTAAILRDLATKAGRDALSRPAPRHALGLRPGSGPVALVPGG